MFRASIRQRSKHIARCLVHRGTASSYSQTASVKPLHSVLIANRGEIALRVGRTASQYGIQTTTLYTDPDARSQHALSSPFAVNLGLTSAYLDGDRIIEVAKSHKCDSIHPGYGFLSENAEFARKCTDAGLKFIGPPWEAIEAMGSKSRSKEIMIAAGVPCIPGYHGANQEPAHLLSEAEKIGFPVLLKAVMGGGGKGMRISQSAADFDQQLESAKTEARNSCGDDTMLVEKYITTPRHIEVQVFADSHGNCVALGERDCSVQRRHQKIMEESPAPNLADDVRRDLWAKARAAALAVNYEGAGTVEFIFDNDSGQFFFMEMNTRLQVEHPVTEMVTGQDLVHWQLQIAEGRPLPLTQEQVEQEMETRGHAFEARIYAENPDMNFMPDSGTLLHLRTPPETDGVRIDAGFVEGDEVSPYYDPMISKLIISGPDRRTALLKMRRALESYEVAGLTTNIKFLKHLCDSADFQAGHVETGYIAKHHDELFKTKPIEPEVWAQTALGLLLQETQQRTAGLPGFSLGFGNAFQSRTFHFTDASPGASTEPVAVTIHQTGPSAFSAEVGSSTFENLTASLVSPNEVQTFFKHTRIGSTVIRGTDDQVTVFQWGRIFRVQVASPKWVEKALGLKDAANSVVAPMPCKVLRVDVQEGDHVVANQPLVVIESMKMETVIRSPQEGVVERVVHRAGDICKAGTALVEFATEA